jgi:DNA-binding PadR family transcriptional regulator
MTPPVFAHGHLRLYLLSILASRPMHGYELIQALGDRFGGTYIPSAGTIYPRLAKLEADGLVAKAADGRKTVYAITAAGRAELDAREGELDDIENSVTDSVRRLADEVRISVNDAMKTLRADLAAAAREARAGANAAGRSIRVQPPRQAGAARLHEAEMVLDEFRHQVRTELRSRLAGGDVPANTVPLLKSKLEEVRAALLANRGTDS